MKKFNKKGDIEKNFIVGVIITIVGAGILLLALGQIQKILNPTIDTESCKISVELRNAAIEKAGFFGEKIGAENIPLRCKTSNLTISTDDPDKIKKEVAEAMYGCWDMMGAGTMHPFTESTWKKLALFGGAESACVVCSIIKFEDRSKGQSLDLLQYLVDIKIPIKNVTYYTYFTEGADAKLATDVQAPLIDTTSKYAVIFMGIKGQTYWETLSNDLQLALGTGGVAGMILGPKLLGKGGAAVLKSPWGWGILAAGLIEQGVATYLSNSYVATKCNGAELGCYQVVLTPFNAEQITPYCQNIESIP